MIICKNFLEFSNDNQQNFLNAKNFLRFKFSNDNPQNFLDTWVKFSNDNL